MNTTNKQAETSKGEQFTTKIPTKICDELATEDNEFIADKQYLYGFDFEELVTKLNYPQMLYLMLVGEIPNEKQSKVLNLLLKLFITPGIRHPATRAAMNAGIGRTHVTHILPISLSVLSSEYLGSVEVGNSMQWQKQYLHNEPDTAISAFESQLDLNKPNPIPGFGTIYGSVDSYLLKFVPSVKSLDEELPNFSAAENLLATLNQKGYRISWLPTGFAAALFLDLGINHRTGIALYQIMQSPGLAAHGVEKANKPLTDMPFIPESNYDIKPNAS